VEARHEDGPQVVRRNADDLQSVAADNGFQDWHTEYEIAAHDIDYLFIIAARQRTQPRKRLNRAKGYSAVDGRNIVFDNEALARRRRASAGLVSTVP